MQTVLFSFYPLPDRFEMKTLHLIRIYCYLSQILEFF